MSEKPKNAWHNVYGVSSGELQNAGKETTERYGDILYAERPHSGRKKNSARSRAAQFLPFAALTGFETEIETEGRYTEERVELSAEELEELEQNVQEIRRRIHTVPEVVLELFEPDPDKQGGSYREVTVRIRKIDELQQKLVTADGTDISFSDIRSLMVAHSDTESAQTRYNEED